MNTFERISQPAIHPIHGLLLAFPLVLFPCGLVADVAYLRSAEMQWSNFAAWLIAGAVAMGALATLWALVALLLNLRRPARGRRGVYLGLLIFMWGLGLINAFKHSQDGWSSVGLLGLGLSIACSGLALVAAMLAFSGFAREVGR